MARIKRGITSRRRHKKIISLAKGYKWLRKNVFKLAKQAVVKAGINAYRDRKLKKRTFRSLWISRISSGLLKHDINYSRFIFKLQGKNVLINRKMLADLAAQHTEVFDKVVDFVQK